MPPTKPRNIEWANLNAQRNYPLTAEATRWDQTQSFRLPVDFLIGLQLSVNFSLTVDPSKFFVYAVGNYTAGFSVTVGYDAGGDSPVLVATAALSRAAHVFGREYRLSGLGDFGDVSGYIVIGSLNGIDDQPPGDWTFDVAGARLETDAIRPYLRGLNALYVDNNGQVGGPYQGDVQLTAGTNIRLSVIQSVGEPTVIVIDAIEGEGLNADCECDDVADTPPIRRISGIPGYNGNFDLLMGVCMAAQPLPHGLQLDNRCSDPCCGCTELEPIVQGLELVQRTNAAQEHLLQRLEASSAALELNVLGSRVGDRGCLECG